MTQNVQIIINKNFFHPTLHLCIRTITYSSSLLFLTVALPEPKQFTYCNFSMKLFKMIIDMVTSYQAMLSV